MAGRACQRIASHGKRNSPLLPTITARLTPASPHLHPHSRPHHHQHQHPTTHGCSRDHSRTTPSKRAHTPRPQRQKQKKDREEEKVKKMLDDGKDIFAGSPLLCCPSASPIHAASKAALPRISHPPCHGPHLPSLTHLASTTCRSRVR